MLRSRALYPLIIITVFSQSVSGLHAENVRARAAAKAYEKAVESAREAYIKELDVAIKEEGAAGNLAEANKLAETKASLKLEATIGDSDPAFVTTRKLIKTRWGNKKNPKGFLQFLENNKTANHLKKPGVWIAADEFTVLTQSKNSGHIYVLNFDKDFKTAIVHRFIDAKEPEKFFRK